MRLVIGNWKFLRMQYATSARPQHKNPCGSGIPNGTASCIVVTKLNFSNTIEIGMLRAFLSVIYTFSLIKYLHCVCTLHENTYLQETVICMCFQTQKYLQST